MKSTGFKYLGFSDAAYTTRCGHGKDKVTTDPTEVTCKLCLREINKDKINSMEH